MHWTFTIKNQIMKNVLFILTILLVACNPTKTVEEVTDPPITYWEYYKVCNLAKDYKDEKEYEKAVETFEQAFQMVEQPVLRDLHIMLEVQHELKNQEAIELYAKKLAKTYGSYPSSKTFTDKAELAKLRALVKPIVEKKKLTFDTDYINILEKLLEKDQACRKGGKVIYPNGVNVDSLNTYELLENIKKRGFPSSDKVGFRGYYNATIILLHADFDKNHELLGDLMLKAIGEGKLRPGIYAEIIDRRSTSEELLYYQVPFGYFELTEDKKNAITERRNKIGLRSVDKSMQMVKLPNGDMRTMMID